MERHIIQDKSEIEQSKVLGKVFWRMVDFYGFNRDQQARLLQKSKNNRGVLATLQKDLTIPDDEPTAIVVAQLAGIHKNLSIIYPEVINGGGNLVAKKTWFKRTNYLFPSVTPLDFIFETENEVIRRLSIVRRALDIERTSV